MKLHKMHILHRDIKPENIFLTSNQLFKLGDFGLAIQSDLELPYTRSGTLDYLSPEVCSRWPASFSLPLISEGTLGPHIIFFQTCSSNLTRHMPNTSKPKLQVLLCVQGQTSNQ